MQDKITIADAPECLNTNDKAMWVLGYQAALEARSTCPHQIQEPEADIWPCVNIDVDESGKITNAKLYSPGLPAGNHDVYPVRVPYMDEHTEAWRACVDELEKAVPGFMSLGNMNGIECAVAAIRGLSERAKHQEPAAAEQAAWHAGQDEGRAQAARPVVVPDDMPSTEANTKYGESYGVDWVYEGKTAAPAAVAWSMPAEPTEQMIEVLMAGEDRLRTRHGDDLPKQRATNRYHALLALAATPAAVPVVLPEPFALYDGEKWYANEEAAICSCADMAKLQKVYLEPQLRALLATATGLRAQAVEPSDAELIALNAGECFFSESPSKYPELGHGTQYHGGAPGVIGFARAALALRADPAAYSQKFQQRVQPWMMTCFGPEISADRRERNHRFLEEALELVQSCGCTASEAHQLVDYVYGRPWGEPAQEAGGVMVTLAALCLANGLDMQACGETELARIWTKVEAIRAKQAAKPKHSPLPEHAPQAQADARENKPLIARQLGEWHEDDGPVAWWAWCGHEWAGEPAWIGSPLSDNWPGYHTHWTPHPELPAYRAAIAAAKGE